MTVEYAAEVWRHELAAAEKADAEDKLRIVEFRGDSGAIVKLSDGSYRELFDARGLRLGDRWSDWEEVELQRVYTAEQDCPGHVASDANSKVCARCGVHIDELRPLED